MPDFIAGSLSAATFCLGLIALNLLTRLAHPILAPDLAEGSLFHYSGAALLAYAAWRRAVRNRDDAVRESPLR